MGSQPILASRFARTHCGQAGIFWNADGAWLPNVSSGFHLEEGHEGPNNLPLAVCDYCDEIMELRPKGQNSVPRG